MLQKRPHQSDTLQSLSQAHFICHDTAISFFVDQTGGAAVEKFDAFDLVGPQDFGQTWIYDNGDFGVIIHLFFQSEYISKTSMHYGDVQLWLVFLGILILGLLDCHGLVKWLGKDAVTPFACDGKASKAELTSQLRQWCIASGRAVVRPVLIVSYETLRLNVDELKNTQIGLLLCDEGHRLKNGESQTFTALNDLNVTRRVILSGTPIQNDLSEYFSLLNFANPSLLGTRNDFRKRYELPILRGRDAAGSDVDRKKGDEAVTELLALVNKFIIRRTNDILSKYLPIKYEHVVSCLSNRS